MTFDGLRIGFAMTGSFCTFSKVMKEIELLRQMGAGLVPVMSEMVWNTDTRFGKAEEFIEKFKNISQKDIIHTAYTRCIPRRFRNPCSVYRR